MGERKVTDYCSHEQEIREGVTHTRQRADNPKRRQREAGKQMEGSGVGTKSQQALQMQLEQNKQERKVQNREQKLAEAERQFALKQRKKREKHKGH